MPAPHTSHRMQPLDVSFMGPLKAYCNKEIRICVRNQEFIRLKNLAGIFKRAYGASSTAEIAISGFRKTGIFHLNRIIFTNDDYAPSLPTQSRVENGIEENIEQGLYLIIIYTIYN